MSEEIWGGLEVKGRATVEDGLQAHMDWLTAIDYIVGDLVISGSTLYRCTTAHTSAVFLSQLAYWTAVASSGVQWIPVNSAISTAPDKLVRLALDAGAGYTITLPAGPAVNDEVEFYHETGDIRQFNVE